MSLVPDNNNRALKAEFPVWGLFGRSLLVPIGEILVVPSPWTFTAFYKFLCEHIVLPDGRRLRFTGQPGDIWHVFVGLSLVFWFDQIVQRSGLPPYLTILGMLATWPLTFLAIKWFCAHVKSQDDRLALTFEGGVWTFIGWNILLILSFVTIIGWAWVAKFMIQWMYRNVRGTMSFEFNATGLAILWRAVVFVLACMFIIPIPWMARWFASWLISQTSARDNS